MSSIVTYTGKRFHLFAPQPDEICIEDIAHALSQLCRFTGHCQRFYSVGQHSVHASRLVPDAYALEALLHDAAEAYVNDLSRPLKHDPRMSGYIDAEIGIDRAIRRKFGLPIIGFPPYMSAVVKETDDKLVFTEAMQLLSNTEWAIGRPQFDMELPEWSCTATEVLFLDRFEELTGIEIAEVVGASGS